MQEQVMSIAQAAARLGCEAKAVIRLHQRGELPGAFKLNDGLTSSWVVPVEDVEAYEKLMRDTVGTGEAAELLGVSQNQAWGAARAGEFPGARKVGGRWRIPKDALGGWEPTPGKAGRVSVYPDEVVAQARALHEEGMGAAEIAELLDGPVVSTVHRWLEGERRADS